MRKPVSAVLNKDGDLTVVCDDVTVWTYSEPSKQPWRQIESLPGTSGEGFPAQFR